MMDIASRIFVWVDRLIFAYVISVTGIYLILFAASAHKLRKEAGLPDIRYEDVLSSHYTPPLSILVPAYNEEAGIVSSIRSLLGINYSEYEIIVINDGSKDNTLDAVIREFDMYPREDKFIWYGMERTPKPIRQVYTSRLHRNLLLIDKENGGKSDALNAGILASKYPYFVSLDGDTVLDSDAFIKVMKPIMEAKPGEEIIASGGSVNIANGSVIDNGHLGKGQNRLARNPLVMMQVIEYFRAFLMGRISLSRFNILLLVSGAFSVFRKDWVIRAGGYELDTIGEDMELVVRLHRMARENKSKARIAYVPDPVCWTEAPDNLSLLRRQRIRWHRGLYESLIRHKKMLFNPAYGAIGFAGMPYFLFVELLGPLVELLGYGSVVFGLWLEAIDVQFAITLFIVMLIYGSFLSMGAVLLEEWGLRRYPNVSDLLYLFFFALTESFWYRPLTCFWRLEGLLRALASTKREWGEMTRKPSILTSGKDRNSAA
ncbi:glycosyltransferase family 2 protein [Paenibacillus beijingensis]|uniref:Glycosyl transferase n=1 Tax=Paenibacillus beijingensis TaxID=1126833 RepID=A0A0D5NRJ3_9BACL|nr:glycosyltransferase [Paenibacillus beijingensis]AJY77523.1 glycosyl transferase [Paenibacillus beijingensis]